MMRTPAEAMPLALPLNGIPPKSCVLPSAFARAQNGRILRHDDAGGAHVAVSLEHHLYRVTHAGSLELLRDGLLLTVARVSVLRLRGRNEQREEHENGSDPPDRAFRRKDQAKRARRAVCDAVRGAHPS
jgi:hypothetical protein